MHHLVAAALFDSGVTDLVRRKAGDKSALIGLAKRMKTRWGSCNPQTGDIRFNTELVKNAAVLAGLYRGSRIGTSTGANS